MAAGDRLWKREFPHARFIEDGWAIGLYTAPHEPCPEGRLVLDYETASGRATRHLPRSTSASRLPPGRPPTAELHFWRAARRVLKGALRFAASYATEAERLAAGRTNPSGEARAPGDRRRLPPGAGRAAAHLPRGRAVVLVHLPPRPLEGAHLGYSPGRLDQLLFPYFAADATLTFEEAVELFEELFVKMTQIEYIASMSWQGLGHGNLFQNCILGGVDGDGRPADNELSLAILQAQINMQMTQPTLSVWYDDSLSEAFLLKAVECVKTGVGYPAFFNQRTYVEHETATSGLPSRWSASTRPWAAAPSRCSGACPTASSRPVSSTTASSST